MRVHNASSNGRLASLAREREHDRWKHACAAPVVTMSHPRSGDADGAGTVSCSHHHRATVSRMTSSIAAEGSRVSGNHVMTPSIHRQRQQVKPR